MERLISTAITLDLLKGDELGTDEAMSILNSEILPKLIDHYSRHDEVYELRRLKEGQEILSGRSLIMLRDRLGWMAVAAYKAYTIAAKHNWHNCPKVEQVCRTLAAAAIIEGHDFSLNSGDICYEVTMMPGRGKIYPLSFIHHKTAATAKAA